MEKARQRLIDIGANMTDTMFQGWYHGKQAHYSDIEIVLKRAWSYGVERIMITGGSMEESQKALDLANDMNERPSIPRLFSTVGCHPTRSKEWAGGYLQGLRDVLNSKSSNSLVVAIGECGLDYDRLEFADIETQKMCFSNQFCLAQEFNLPMFFHCRNAYSDFKEIVLENRRCFSTGVVHSFTGTKSEAQSILNELDLYIGLNGCSFKTAESLDVIREVIPLERILFETDAPWCDVRPTHAGYKLLSDLQSDGTMLLNCYDDLLKTLSKHPYVSKEKYNPDLVDGPMVKGRNEPCTILRIAAMVSFLKKVPLDQVIEIVRVNTLRVFFKVK
jgi:TatD DNase family protein